MVQINDLERICQQVKQRPKIMLIEMSGKVPLSLLPQTHEFELHGSTYTHFFNKYIGNFFEDLQQFEKKKTTT